MKVCLENIETEFEDRVKQLLINIGINLVGLKKIKTFKTEEDNHSGTLHVFLELKNGEFLDLKIWFKNSVINGKHFNNLGKYILISLQKKKMITFKKGEHLNLHGDFYFDDNLEKFLILTLSEFCDKINI